MIDALSASLKTYRYRIEHFTATANFIASDFSGLSLVSIVTVTVREDMFRRRIPFTQIAFATLLGVAGGIYIYRPYFEPVLKPSGEQKQDVPKKHKETE